MHDFTVTEWKELFAEIGLSEDAMHKWHNLFESRYPQAHQSFLEWLGFDAEQVKDIRTKSAGPVSTA